MAAKSGRVQLNKTTNKGAMSIHLRIFIVIIAVATVVNVCGLLAGAWFLTRSISVSMEDDLKVAVYIAEQFVEKEIELLKVKASDAAMEINQSYMTGETEGVLERVYAGYTESFIGLAAFDKTALLDSCGGPPVDPDLFLEPFMRIAINGGQAVSSTMYAFDGETLVMYLAVPVNDDTVLAAALDGMYFHNLLSRFTFWQTGHIFINDGKGFVVSNPRPQWVRERYNFLDMAKADGAYEGLAATTRRAISGETGTGRYHINGVLRLCAFRPVSNSNEGWFVAIVAPLVETAVKDIPGGILLMGIFTLILSVPVAVAAAAILKRPYKEADRLREAAEIASADLALKTVTLSTLFDSIPDLIFTLDKTLNFTQCNKSFAEHFGIRKEDLIGKNEITSRLFPKETAEEHIQWNRKVFEEGQTFVIEEYVPRCDGATPLFETVKAPLMLNGKIVGVLGIVHDITKRKEMEDAVLAASNSKSAFLANMSHEIRTPMNSIIGFSELALAGETSEKTRDYLGKIQTNAEWLLQIINDILDVSKVESGKMELESIPFDMHDLFVSCRTLILPKALEKGLRLHFYAEPSMGKRPLGDPTRLRQVFINLLANAVKFTNTGMIKLHSSITAAAENTVAMHFEVKDSGIGMTAEQVKKIFDPFMQAESGTTRKYGGTGLGLAITKSIVELMGGELFVESAPGLGSKFSFDLVFETVDLDDDVLSEKNVIFNELEKPAFDGEILLCEDNAMNQEVICEHLARVGLKTVIAENGKIGVELVQSRMRNGEKQFDLIFMDMHMPVMDGIEAAEKINGLNTGIPIVAMTANIMSNDREIYKSYGMNDCVGKPFTSQELWRCLMKYFKQASRQTENETPRAQDEIKLRHKLTANFIKENRNRFGEIIRAVDAGDIKTAHRLAHSLKSNAGHLGKILLQKAAADVEDHLKDGRNMLTPQQTAALETELNAALTELAAELETNSMAPPDGDDASVSAAAPVTEPVDAEFAKALIEKLAPMLEMGNLDCRGHIDSLRRIPGTEELIRHMDDLDFEEALAALAGLKKHLGMGE